MSSRRSTSAGTAMRFAGEQAKSGRSPPAAGSTHVASGRGDHPHVGSRDSPRRWRASICFQHLVKLVLELRRQLVDRVEKQRAARSELELAREQDVVRIDVATSRRAACRC